MWQPEGIVNRKLGGEYHQPSTQPHPIQTSFKSESALKSASAMIANQGRDDDSNADDNNGNNDKDGGNDGNDLEARRRRPWRVTSPRESQANTSEINCELNCEK